MVKRIALMAFVAAFVMSGSWVHAPASARAEEDAIAVFATVSFREPVSAWVEVFAAANADFVYEVTFFDNEDDLLAGIAGADIIFTSGFASAPPIDLACGVISRSYVVLPDLGARYLASEDCGDFVSQKTPIMKAFLTFAVSPDGQQIAIDLGLLPDSVELVDQGGVTVTIPQPVYGMVSAYGVATYYVYTVGAKDRLLAANYVGVGGAAVKESIMRVDPDFETKINAVSAMSQKELSIEETAALGPDLLLASARTQWLDTVSELGIPVLRFEGESPELLKEAMTLIGQALGPDAAYRAVEFNAYYDAKLAEIEQQVSAVDDTLSVYFSGTDPLRVASSDMYQSAMITLAGGESVSASLIGYWNDVNLEQVLVWNPDVIFVPTYGGASVEAFTGSAEWAIVPAVAVGRVYQLPKFISPWDTPLPDSILGIMWIAETLYPDQIDLDCPAQTTYFYETFYDYAISYDEVQVLCQ